MKPQAFQQGEIRDEDDNIIRTGAYGKKTAFATADNNGIIDYIINNFDAVMETIAGGWIYEATKDDFPTKGDGSKIYVAQDTGKMYKWNEKEYIAITSPVAPETITEATTDSEGNLVLNLEYGESLTVPLQPLIDAKTYADNASASAGNAKTSETNASKSATAAASSASAASTSAGNAKTSETNAADSAAAAASSASTVTYASQEEVKAGTEAAKMVSPATLKGMMDSVLSEQWHAAYPVGRHIISMNSANPNTYLPYMSDTTWELTAQGRVLIGAGTGTDINGTSMKFKEGDTGGEYTHKLTVDEMPDHKHKIEWPFEGGDYGKKAPKSSHYIKSGTLLYASSDVTNLNASNNVYTNSSGQKKSHNNIQPYITVYVFKRSE